jgi:hypothetical protein
MAAEQGTLTVRPAVSPNLEAASLENAGAFLRAAGLVFDEITATRVSGHVDLNPDHHTPWGIRFRAARLSFTNQKAPCGAGRGVRPDRACGSRGCSGTRPPRHR